MNASTIYIALLRGINVGGNSLIKMSDLKSAFELLGYKNVRTVLASGNVIFETAEKNSYLLTEEIEKTLSKSFHRDIRVFIRSNDEIEKLISADPFKQIHMNSKIRLYITFTSDNQQSKLPIPYQSPEKDFTVLRVINREICSVLEVSAKRGSGDLMKIIEKEFGKNITTRNWNTLLKIANTAHTLLR